MEIPREKFSTTESNRLSRGEEFKKTIWAQSASIASIWPGRNFPMAIMPSSGPPSGGRKPSPRLSRGTAVYFRSRHPWRTKPLR